MEKVIPALFENQLVELLVVGGKLLDVTVRHRLLHGGLIGSQLLQVALRHVGAGQSCGHALQRGADIQHFPNFLLADIRHHRALIALHLHQPQRLQMLQRLPHRGAADGIFLRQLHFHQPFPWFVFPGDNGSPEQVRQFQTVRFFHADDSPMFFVCFFV